ncbi:MAG: hypothetical protein ACYTFK_10040 [Planctomycetota bacterium]|jgi:hypothetical protein
MTENNTGGYVAMATRTDWMLNNLKAAVAMAKLDDFKKEQTQKVIQKDSSLN